MGWGKVLEAVRELKVVKVPGVDGILAEMLKYGDEVVVEWMVWILSLAWVPRRVAGD